MKRPWLLSIAAASALLAAAASAAPSSTPRIVSLDAGTTETLFALGVGDQVVARDSGSTYPEAARALPEIGAGHQISVEAVLALRPTLVVGRDRSMHGPSMHLLEQARVKVVRLDDAPGVEAAKARITRLGELVGKPERAVELNKEMDADLDRLRKRIDAQAGKSRPRVLIVYLRPGVTLLMGSDSNAAAMVNLANGAPALPDLEGYKPMNAEAVVAARPDAILCFQDGLESTGGAEALWDRPGLRETPAGRAKRLIVMDDRLLAGFGPRTGEAALQLFDALHPAAAVSARATP